MSRSSKLSAAFALTASLFCQTTPQDRLLQETNRIAQQQLAARDRAMAAIHTVADADNRKKLVRATLLDIIGGLPDNRSSLNAKITGHLQRDSYVIDKVLFESLPDFYVSANVYRPNQPGRYPAVLLPSGHTQQGKPEPQIIAANLAMGGFVAMTFDPVGQGEREQTYIPMLGRPLAGGSVNEHLYAGAQSILIGESVARFFIWDAMRALDYLASRPDVDAHRLAVSGCSGGGAITTYIGALDARVKAVAPACFIDSYKTLFTGPVPDSEMSLPGFLARGLDISDLVELTAPKPWLLLATEQDFFTPAGARVVFEDAKPWFRLYGAEDRLQFFVGPGPHGTPLETREQIYRFMTRWLKEGQGEFHERPVKEFSNLDLLVTPTGHVPGRKLFELIRDDYRARKQPRPVAALQAELRALAPAEADSIPHYYVPKTSGRKPAVLILQDRPEPVPLHVSKSRSTQPLAESLMRSGKVVLELEVRGAPAANEGRPFTGNTLENARANLVGQNLPAMRVRDILHGVDLLASRDDVDPTSIAGFARGVKGIWLLMAGAIDPRLRRIWLDRTPHSFEAAFDSPIGANLFEAGIPGFALHWDLRDLVKAMGERKVLWTDPTNWMDEVVPLGPAFQYRYTDETDESVLARWQ